MKHNRKHKCVEFSLLKLLAISALFLRNSATMCTLGLTYVYPQSHLTVSSYATVSSLWEFPQLALAIVGRISPILSAFSQRQIAIGIFLVNVFLCVLKNTKPSSCGVSLRIFGQYSFIFLALIIQRI